MIIASKKETFRILKEHNLIEEIEVSEWEPIALQSKEGKNNYQ